MESKWADDSSAAPIAHERRPPPTFAIARHSKVRKKLPTRMREHHLESFETESRPRRPLGRRELDQAAMEGPEVFEISAIVFDTRSGLSFSARSA